MGIRDHRVYKYKVSFERKIHPRDDYDYGEVGEPYWETVEKEYIIVARYEGAARAHIDYWHRDEVFGYRNVQVELIDEDKIDHLQIEIPW